MNRDYPPFTTNSPLPSGLSVTVVLDAFSLKNHAIFVELFDCAIDVDMAFSTTIQWVHSIKPNEFSVIRIRS